MADRPGRNKKYVDYAKMGGADSDDDFSSPTPPEQIPQKKSKLSRKKVTRPLAKTSTQMDEVLLGEGRAGRPRRRTNEELKFEKDLEAAIKISEVETESSGDLVPVGEGKTDELVHGPSSADTVVFDPQAVDSETDEDSPDDTNKKTVTDKGGSSEDGKKEYEVAENVGENRKRKREEEWIVSKNPNNSKKLATNNDNDEDYSGEESGGSNDSDEEFQPEVKRGKAVKKTLTDRKTPVKSKITSSKGKTKMEKENKPSPRAHSSKPNPVKTSSKPLPSSTPPVSTSTPVRTSTTLAKTNSGSGPVSFQMPSPLVATNRPKIPHWTPPARVGGSVLSPKVGAAASPAGSPAIGLRVGLSRNMRVSKPLHSNVKGE